MDLAAWRTAVEADWRVLEVAPKELTAEKEVMLKAVGQAGHCLSYASEELQGDPAVALCALRSEADAFEFVSPQLQQAGTGLSGGAEKESGSLSHTRPVQPQARASGVPSSARNWNALQYASVELRRDAELCLEAVQQHWRALIHVDDSLWADRDFMLKAIRCRWQCVQFLCLQLDIWWISRVCVFKHLNIREVIS
ncbi:Uncharacterized protein SCF082_LOCUS39465 [Durusdinium trenchii]|uniref:DUF4116 domain-containing protein n=1 Tax=Durusdinium trenchii TaxID=1381693 RepID=A0ABP0Q7X2_9DINO